MTTTRALIVLAGSALFFVGCDSKPSAPAKPATPAPTSAHSTPPPAAPAAPTAPTGAAMGATVSAMGLTFTVPQGWKQVPPANQMRLAEINVPDASGDAAKACSVVFSTAGGDVQANIDRWAGQVKDASGQPAKPTIQTRTVGGLKVTIAEMSGTYAGMGEAAPRPDWVLRGAVVETKDGLLFVKMNGPVEQMASTGAAFNALIDSLK